MERFLAAFTGSHRYVVDYLAEEIFQQQPAPVQEFLLNTSILERLTAPLCDALIGSQGSQQILEQLEQTNLLLVPLDEQRRWYRYHQLLATFLRNRLLAQRPSALRPLHLAAAAWYQAEGIPAEAILHLLAVEAWAEAAQMIERSVDGVLLRGETASVQRWLAALPPAVIQARPSLSITRAWMAVLSGQDGEQAVLIEAAVHALAEADKRGELTDAARVHNQGQIEVLQANQALAQGEAGRSIELARQALDHLSPDNPLLHTMVAMILAAAYRQRGEPVLAQQVLADVQIRAQKDSPLAVLLVQAQLHMAQGRLREAARLYRHILRMAQEQGQTPDAVSAVRLNLGQLLYEWNELDEAERLLRSALEAFQAGGQDVQQVIAGIHLARLQIAQSQNEVAALTFRAALDKVGQLHASEAEDQMAAVGARLALMQGDEARVQRWAQRRRPPQSTDAPPAQPLAAQILVRLAIRQGRADEALTLLKSIGQPSGGGDWQRDGIERLLLHALVNQVQGDEAQAIDMLAQALAAAEPEGYLRLFVDEGSGVVHLLQSLRRAQVAGQYRHISGEYVDELLAAFAGAEGEAPSQGEPAIPRRAQPLIEPLTDRELDVLRAMTEGLSNAEIADHLVVAVSTVRTHIKNVYGKLAVRNRVEAVTKGQELGLLEGM